ncbi:metalloregulator ArsR/SmtB family transcription factor [Providencia rettgeri]|uniref:metalloregulator ArsR/SmtB family transcription factor n=1 Tax=Providencia rettgeri TaxID=587 RepID=UPI0034E0A043
MAPLQLFKILSDQTRLDILLLLKASGELCVCDIYTALNLSQPKTSRHLAMLRESALLLDSKHGKWVHYRLSPALLPWVKSIIDVTYATEKNRILDLLKRIEEKKPVNHCTE